MPKTSPHSILRPLLAALLCLLLNATGPAAAQATGASKDTPWDSLMPKDWDPMKQFREFGAGAGVIDDASPKARNLMRELREVWDNAPTNTQMNGERVRLPGYIVPLEEAHGELKEFLLVPYYGACIHSPPPPSNQIVHVVSPQPLKGLRSMDAVWVSGTLKVQRQDSAMGVAGYQILRPAVERYVAPAPQR
jgi:uncharacterized protein